MWWDAVLIHVCVSGEAWLWELVHFEASRVAVNHMWATFLDAAPSPWLCSLTDDQSCSVCAFNLTANQKSCSSCIFDKALMDECPSPLTDLYANTPTCSCIAPAIFLLEFFVFLSAFISVTDYHGVPPSAFVTSTLSLSDVTRSF